MALASLLVVSSSLFLLLPVGRGGFKLALRIQIHRYPAESSARKRVALLQRVLEPNGPAVHPLLLELDAHVDLVDAHLSEDAPAIWRLTLAAAALIVELDLRPLTLLLLLQLLGLLLESAEVLHLLGA